MSVLNIFLKTAYRTDWWIDSLYVQLSTSSGELIAINGTGGCVWKLPWPIAGLLYDHLSWDTEANHSRGRGPPRQDSNLIQSVNAKDCVVLKNVRMISEWCNLIQILYIQAVLNMILGPINKTPIIIHLDQNSCCGGHLAYNTTSTYDRYDIPIKRSFISTPLISFALSGSQPFLCLSFFLYFCHLWSLWLSFVSLFRLISFLLLYPSTTFSFCPSFLVCCVSELYCQCFTTVNAALTVADILTLQRRLPTVGANKHSQIHYITQTFTDLRGFIYSIVFIALTDLFRKSG